MPMLKVNNTLQLEVKILLQCYLRYRQTTMENETTQGKGLPMGVAVASHFFFSVLAFH